MSERLPGFVRCPHCSWCAYVSGEDKGNTEVAAKSLQSRHIRETHPTETTDVPSETQILSE